MKFVPLVVFTGFALCLTTIAMADLDERCRFDQLQSRSLATERNQWSRKCGYIKSDAMLEAMNSEGTYLVFSNGRLGGGGGNLNVPADKQAACISGLIKQGFCFAGCYTPGQRLTFINADEEISAAYHAKRELISALAVDTKPATLSFSEQKISSFIAGETSEEVLTITSEGRHQLTVTLEHPLVLAAGTIIKARDVALGDYLLTAEGEAAAVVSIVREHFTGKVWNVRPASHNKLENILIAEGLLSGSQRFQSQWSGEITRLYQRSETDISGL